MKVNLDHIQLIDTIDRLGSFSAAAEHLFKAKSAVTYALKQMEDALGVSLFDRSGYKPVLTEAGKLVLQDGRKLLHDAHALEKRLAQVSSGYDIKFQLAVDEAIAGDIYPLLAPFYTTFSQTHLLVQNEVLGGCWDALIDHRVDMAIGVSGLMPATNDICLVKLGLLHFDFVVAADHPLAKEQGVLSFDQINDYVAIRVIDSARYMPEQSYDAPTRKQLLSVSSIAAKLELIAQGVGVGFLPRVMIQNNHASRNLVIKKTEVKRPPAHMFMAYHKDKQDNRIVQWWLKQLGS